MPPYLIMVKGYILKCTYPTEGIKCTTINAALIEVVIRNENPYN